MENVKENATEEELKKFAVVDFLNGEVEAVPTRFLKAPNKCAWPNQIPSNLSELLKNPAYSPGKAVTLYTCKVIKAYDTFKKASKRAKQYLETSDLESSEGEKRKKTDALNVTSDQTDCIPPATGYFQLTSGVGFSSLAATSSDSIHLPQSQVQVFDEVELLDVISSSALESGHQGYLNNSPASIIESRRAVEPSKSYTLESTPERAQSTRETPNVTSRLLRRIPHCGCESLRTEFQNFQAVVLEKQEELKSELKDLKTLLLNVLAGQSGGCQSSGEIHGRLPIASEKDLLEVESALANDSQYQDLVNLLSRIGGDTVPKNVYNVLRVVIGHDMSLRIRYTAASGKLPFGNTLLAKCIRDAIHKSPNDHKTTDEAINDYISRWFRNSKDKSTEKNGKNNSKKHEAKMDTQSGSTSNQENSVGTQSLPSEPNTESSESGTGQ